MTKKSRQKVEYFEDKKRWYKKHFFIIFKKAFVEANKIIFLEGESPTLN